MKLLKNSNIGGNTGTYTNCHDHCHAVTGCISFNESNEVWL